MTARVARGRRRGRLAAGLCLLACAGAAPVAQAADGAVSVGVVVPGAGPLQPVGEAVLRGAELGAAEAARAAELLGRGFTLAVERAATAAEIEAAVHRLVGEQAVVALVGGVDAASCWLLGELAERHGVLFLNVGCAEDELRSPACRRNSFHLQASEAMRRDALALAAPAGAAAAGARAALWHPTLNRFGAEQLNDRYQERFGRPMDAAGWAGWFAVKLLWEAALRARATDAAALVRHLEAERTQFDGHKGRPLSFRPHDHQLRQPLYIVGDEGDDVLVGEVPPGRPAAGQSSREFLDQLGGSSGSACGWSARGDPDG